MAELVTSIDQWYVVQLQGLRKLYASVALVAEPYDCDTPLLQPPLNGLAHDFGRISIPSQ